MNDFLTCDVRLLARKVREPNQADQLVGHIVEFQTLVACQKIVDRQRRPRSDCFL